LGDAGLQAGQVLSIPLQAGGSVNGAGDFRVYDAASVVGDTSPNMPAPPPAKKGGCGFLGKLIMIVVAIVVTAGVGSYLGFQAGAGFTAGNVAAGAAGAAAGSIGSWFAYSVKQQSPRRIAINYIALCAVFVWAKAGFGLKRKAF
jgi:hypothetical protein